MGDKRAGRKAASKDGDLQQHLKRFTVEAIVSEEQKRALKKAGMISWEHGMWGLTTVDRAEAERLGYL